MTNSSPIRILDLDDLIGLSFDCDELPVDGAIAELGHEPNGYFWEGLIRYLFPQLSELLDFDPEAGMFCAYGELADLKRLELSLEPYLREPELVAKVIQDAEAVGFEFDD